MARVRPAIARERMVAGFAAGSESTYQSAGGATGEGIALMMDLILHLFHFCASCVSDSNALPPAAGLIGGAAGAAGGLSGLSGLQGSSDHSGIPPDGPIVPPVNASAPPTQPNAQPGKSASHGNGPAAAPTPSDPGNPIVESTNPD